MRLLAIEACYRMALHLCENHFNDREWHHFNDIRWDLQPLVGGIEVKRDFYIDVEAREAK